MLACVGIFDEREEGREVGRGQQAPGVGFDVGCLVGGIWRWNGIVRVLRGFWGGME